MITYLQQLVLIHKGVSLFHHGKFVQVHLEYNET
jgi:hypothetical protein